MSMRLLGVSGVGKSFVLEEYRDANPPFSAGCVTMCPVVYCAVPSAPTKRGLYKAILHGMGTSVTAGTADDLRFQLTKLFDTCGVEIVLIDEIHHFIDRGKASSHAAAADALKELMDRTRRPFVFAGAPRSDLLFNFNTQLRSRVMAPYRMNPFDLEDAFGDLRGYIKALAESIGIDKSKAIWLAGRDMAARIFFATDGIHRVIRHFLDRLHATTGEGDDWTAATLAQVFDSYLWQCPAEDLNPFNQDFPMRRLSRNHEPYCPSPQDGDNHETMFGTSNLPLAA